MFGTLGTGGCPSSMAMAIEFARCGHVVVGDDDHPGSNHHNTKKSSGTSRQSPYTFCGSDPLCFHWNLRGSEIVF